jgi:hypothetical protein
MKARSPAASTLRIVLGWEQVAVPICRHGKCAVAHADLHRLERQPEAAVLKPGRGPAAEENAVVALLTEAQLGERRLAPLGARRRLKCDA